ncbi:acyl-CoA dehydrogenase family protein [Sedimentitalea sp. XS_ASV28]|uniref:acyl-CoA dehydrogenase family protein n=1 Tax=Sedimentitalea sp. XS_ASV28 TaxID=3241296 RepID=UPI003510F0D6
MLSPLSLSNVPAEDEAVRAEVRAFAQQETANLPAVVRARSWMGFSAEFSRKMAEKGWLGLSIEKKYGGQEAGFFRRYVIVEELLAAGAPVSAHWIADRQSGPLIQRYGSEEQKQRYLPGICAGQSFFCIGMSEPNAGSDLASVRSRAKKTDGGWLLNGQKIWTTNATRSHYMIALVRTSGNAADRHQGLSQFVIDLSAPRVEIREIKDLNGDAHFSEVFFKDVFLPDNTLIGDEGCGWEQVTAELAFERSGPERILSSIVLLDGWLNWLRATPQSHDEKLGRAIAHLATLRELSIAVTARLAAGESPIVQAAMVKDLGTSFEQELPVMIADALSADPRLQPPRSLMETTVFVARAAPSYSLRGGTREILRGMIARGLGLR